MRAKMLSWSRSSAPELFMSKFADNREGIRFPSIFIFVVVISFFASRVTAVEIEMVRAQEITCVTREVEWPEGTTRPRLFLPFIHHHHHRTAFHVYFLLNVSPRERLNSA